MTMNVLVLARIACVVCFSFVIASCSLFIGEKGIFKNTGKDYLKTGSLEPIQVPEGMASKSLSPLYRVPDVVSQDEFGDNYNLVEYKIPLPNPINTDKSSSGVKIQKLNNERWIFVKAPTAQVWPRTQNFLSEYGIAVHSSNPNTGVIETDWVEFKDDTTLESRFLIELEKGIHAETTEVHVSQVERSSSSPGSTDPVFWPSQSMNKVREKWMIDELAQELAKNINNSSASLMGQTVGGETKAGLIKRNGEPMISLRLSPDRAWGSLIHSARLEGFVSWEASEEKGLIYVAYDKEQLKKKGFFRRLAFWSKSNKVPTEGPYDLNTLIQHLENDVEISRAFAHIPKAKAGDELPKGRGYLIKVTREADTAYISIRDHRGRLVPNAQLKDMLRILRKNLI